MYRPYRWLREASVTYRAILKPYERRQLPGRAARTIAGASLILVAAFYGLMCSVLPMRLLVIPAIPVLLMFGLALWMLPDIGGIYDQQMETFMVWYVGLNVLWPGYVALNAPGLPWISPPRVVLAGLLAVVLFNISTSKDFRSALTERQHGLPMVRRVFYLFWTVTLVSLVFSDAIAASLLKFINNQIYWTMMFLVSAFLATRGRFVERLGNVIAWTTIALALIGIYESRLQAPFWLNHLPSFLQADYGLLGSLSQSSARAGTEEYRIRGTFANPTYFAEYLGLAIPFVVHALAQSQRFWHVVLLSGGLLAVSIAAYLTHTRSAMLALLISLVIYPLFASLRSRRAHPNSIAATAVVAAYPIALALLAALVVFWRRLHVLIIGGGQHQASTDAREAQWAMGWPKVFSHPLGHGVGRAGDVLGYTNLAGEGTIDSGYLSLLLDYGPLGLAAFLAMLIMLIWAGYRLYTDARSPSEQMIAPMTIGAMNFLIIKSVMSNDGNWPIVFILSGCIVGLVWARKAQNIVQLPESSDPSKASLTGPRHVRPRNGRLTKATL